MIRIYCESEKNGNKDLLIKWLERDLIFHIQVKRFL